jgi:putative tryptophan/tyrosine transport system substrate-binding protein
MDRRAFLCGLTLRALAAPLAAEAQPAGSALIGVLGSGSQSAFTAHIDAFRQALRERGYVEGRSVRLEERWAEGRLERLPELAAELVRLNVDAIVASGGTPVVLAAKRATNEIPIVFTAVGDPVGQKLVDSLGRPGANITGLSIMSELGPKRLELMTQALPNVKRIGVLMNLANAARRAQTAWMQDAALTLKIDLRVFDVRQAEAISGAFANMAKQQVGAVIIHDDPVIFSDRARPLGSGCPRWSNSPRRTRTFSSRSGRI